MKSTYKLPLEPLDYLCSFMWSLLWFLVFCASRITEWVWLKIRYLLLQPLKSVKKMKVKKKGNAPHPAHCSKSSFFVQKFNFDFPRKLSIFWGWKTRENVVFLDFLAVDNFDFTRKIVEKNLGENSWKCCGFGLFSCWQLWFHEKKCQKNLGWKTRENVVVLDFLAVDNFDFTRKIAKKKFGMKNSRKCWGFFKIEFLDKNLTFRTVCPGIVTMQIRTKFKSVKRVILVKILSKVKHLLWMNRKLILFRMPCQILRLSGQRHLCTFRIWPGKAIEL